MPPPPTAVRPFTRRSIRRGAGTSLLGIAVAGAMHIVRIASLAALLYAGVSAELRADGLALALIGTTVACVWIALRTSMPGVHASQQGVSVAIIAVAMSSAMSAAAPGSEHATALATVTAGGALTGLVLSLLGVTGASRLVRYLPHPVVGGVLAATGWILVTGAVTMMAGGADGGTFSGEALLHWLPGVAIGMWLVAFNRVVRHPMTVPGVLLVSGLAFYGVAWANGVSFERLMADGWLFGPFPDGALWRLPPVEHWMGADLTAMAAQAPALLTAAVTTALLVVLYVSAMELERDVDAAPGRDLREAGVGNLLGAVFAGLPTAASPSASRLARSMRVRRRTDAALTPLVVLPVLAVGADVLGGIPLPVLGGLLVFLGAQFLDEWLLTGWRRLSWSDLTVVAAIVGAVAVFGLLAGVGVGLVLAVVLFVVAVARTDVVAEAKTGLALRSRVTRSPDARELLRNHGDRVVVYRVQGTVFFGTADHLVGRVKRRLGEDPPPRYVVLDVKGASTFDATGGVAVLRVVRAADQVGAAVVVVGAGKAVRRTLEKAGARVRFEEDLDRALEACEDGLLAGSGVGATRAAFEDVMRDLPGGAAAWTELRPWFERVAVPAGGPLVRQGEPGDCFWILAEGRITAERERDDGSRLRLETLVPGQVLGEVGYVTGEPRSAHLVADEASALYRMDRDGWEALARERPDLAIRLRDMLLRLTAERVKHLSTALAATGA